MATDTPIATVYVRNLEERVKPESLRNALEAIFSEFGTVVDIVAKTNLKAKGQAFIVFADPADAQRAVAEAQGFELFGKPLMLAMARTHSDATVAQTNPAMLEAHQQHRREERDKKKKLEEAETQKKQLQKAATSGTMPPNAIPDEFLPPNKTLFVQHLPADCDSEQLTVMFGRFAGFLEVRVVPSRQLAFVEYETDADATAAKEETAGTVMGTGDTKRPIKVTYQRQ